MENLINRYQNSGFQLSINEERMVARCAKNLSSLKSNFHYCFPSLERLEKYCSVWIESIEKNLERKRLMKEKKSEIRKNLANNMPYKVGQILYSSWGYEQTNVEFYQIVAIKNKSIVIREISKYFKSYESHGMAGQCFPHLNSFESEESLHVVQVSVWNENVSYHVKNKNGHKLFNYKENEGVYCSWYY